MNAAAQARLRFAFGENWARYLAHLSGHRIGRAENVVQISRAGYVGKLS